MKQRTIRTESELKKLSADVLCLAQYMPFVVSVTQGTAIRSEAANARHWVMIEDLLNHIREAVEIISEATGYTPAEVKKLAAADMPPEHVGILYARTKQAVHDELKGICNIPTSTRLGTKAFSRFDEILEGTVAQVIGEVNAVSRKALS